MRTIELFFRGEFWLHLVTMFFFTVLFAKIANPPIWVLAIIIVVVAIGWEFFWKYKRQNPIDFWNILGTILGGFIAIALNFQ